MEIFFGDERFVPPDHPDSNYRMVRETLLAGGTVQPRAIFAMPTDGTPESAADAYEEILRQQYGASRPRAGRAAVRSARCWAWARTAIPLRCLPGQPVLNERERWVAVVPEGRDEPRITLTYPALESSRLIRVSGERARPSAKLWRGPGPGIQPFRLAASNRKAT